jgi:exonuclease VII small subunit
MKIEIVVTTRIRSSIKHAEELRKHLQHYEKKVRGLDGDEERTAEGGKELSSSAKDKLKRNHEKLEVAHEEYDKYATSVCNLIDSALDFAWTDMTPVVYRLACMELDRLGGETIRDALVELVTKLQKLSAQHNIDTSMPDPAAKPSSPSRKKK